MIEQLTKEEFNEFAKTHENSSFFQSSYWGDLKSITGWQSHLVGLKKDGKILCATLMLSKKIPIFKKNIFYAPRGFLIDYSNHKLLSGFIKEARKYVKKNNGIFLKINPLVSYQQRDINGNILKDGYNNQELINFLIKNNFDHTGFTTTYGKDLEPRWISVLDLKNKTEDQLLRDMRATTRLAINNSYKHGLNLIEIDESRIEEFKDLMIHTGERRGFIDRSLSYYKKMYNVFSKDDYIKIMLVELDIKKYLEKIYQQKKDLDNKILEIDENTSSAKGKRLLKELSNQLLANQKKINDLEILNKNKGDKIVIAGGLFMTFGTQVISLFGASYKEYMKYDGQYFLNFEMIKYALKNNYEKYNFLGITGDFDEKSKMYGLFDFKRGFNSEVVELIGEFTLITDKITYSLYIVMFKAYKKIKKWRNK